MFATSKQKAGAPESVSNLVDVIERFNESSSKLELRHTVLMKEIEDLREQVRKKDEEMKRSERLAMLGETAAALAHEVRNPLGAIALFVSMLKNDLSRHPQPLALVEEIEKSISSLDQVVSNVLHFAKNNKLHLGPVNIHSLAQEVRHHFFGLYGQNVTIDLEVNGNPFIIADGQGLRQCFYNLITNALQVTAFSGAIAITVILVRDDGVGIPQEIMERLFEPFASGRREGTGLGLSIVKRIVVAHGGEISAQNTPGAQFTIRLPRRAVQG
jgi:signal transduction histidine kinase